MAGLAALLCLAIAAVGCLGVASPPRLLALVRRLQSPVGLWLAALVRLALGGSLTLAAPGSRAPTFLHWLGLLIVAVALVTPLFGVERFQRLVAWWEGQGTDFVRAWSLAAVAFGLGLAWLVVA